MRVLMFLRSTNKYGTKGEYTSFRKLLSSSGFVLLQPEVFLAVAPTRRAVQQLLARMSEAAPSTGCICALVLTERQYATMQYLVGEAPYQEAAIGSRASVDL